MANKTFSARYAMIAAKNRWEEQGFFLHDSQVNYDLEQFIYNRLHDLSWFRFARQPARANLNWVLEFYTSNSAGEDNATVRGRRVAANVATINAILGLPDNDPSFYAMLRALEQEDFEQIKDFLYEEGTAWNTTGRNPHSVSRLSLRPEAKLWNTFVKRNIMPTFHNQTVDRTRLLLIHTIMTGYRINIGEILAKVLVAACANDKGILAFPCLISALCRRAAVPTSPGDKYQPEKTGWTRDVYMRKMDVADATPLNVAMPTLPSSLIHTTAATADEAGPSAPVALSEEAAPPLHILQLRSQLQRIEARKLQFQEETKVFNQSLINFLCFQFPSAVAFFAQPPSAPPQPNFSAAAQPQPSANTSAKAGAIEEVHLSSDDENDIFDWQSPRDHLHPISPAPQRADAPESSTSQQSKNKEPAEVPILALAPTLVRHATTERPAPESPARRKGKATAGRTVGRHTPSSPDEEEFEQRPAKRQRQYHVITPGSDDDSSAEIPVSQPEKSVDPSLSSTL
ncbi:hypothetical protein V6N13_009374 [Hibiscus sabdariffa]